MAQTEDSDRAAIHRNRLGVLSGAPECVVKAVHLALIKVHHPDVGGDANAAKEINAAYDVLKGQGSRAKNYVEANFNGEPTQCGGKMES